MGARPCNALTEKEIIIIQSELNKQDNDLKYVFNILVYTGIRISDWSYLADEWNRNKLLWLDVFIPKQSRVKEAKRRLMIKRLIKMPTMTYKALLNKDFELASWSESNVKAKTAKIAKIANDLGISRKISPHDFRATFINMLKHRGYDIWDVQSITKHASIESLTAYFARDTDMITNAYESLEHDPYDLKHPKLLAKKLREQEDEIALLRKRLEKYETN